MSKAREVKIVNDFNRRHPVGSLVLYRLDNGMRVTRIVTSVAWLLGGHTAVAMFENMRGAQRIGEDRVFEHKEVTS